MCTINQIFWNVDTQVDFMDPEGKLYVPDAEKLIPILKKLTQIAKELNIQVVNTADYHYINSSELDKNPDMVNTFPEHCMAGSNGADYIQETAPEYPTIFDWNRNYIISSDIANKEKHRNLIIRKDAFDVFVGNPHTERILNIINPDIIYVYGVTTNVCVNYAVVNLAKKGYKVKVIKDAIKELPHIPLPFQEWLKLGVEMIDSKNLIENLKVAV